MQFTLSAQKRTEKPEDVRTSGSIPAVVYGPEIEPISIAVDYNTFEKLYNEAGMSTMIDVSVDGAEPIKSLIQDIQLDPVKNTITHADFRQIKMGEEMHATIVLEFEGVAPAEKELGGTLQKTLREVNVRCLPKDLVSHIIVDISVLKTFDDNISIGDLKLPEGIIITDDFSTPIAVVIEPLTDEQFKAMEEEGAVNVADIEVEDKKKEDEKEDGDKKSSQDKK